MSASKTSGVLPIDNALESKKTSRIQIANREKILVAATKAFAQHGFRGTTVSQIANASEMSKANLLYYFPTKNSLYLAVLQRILEIWLKPLTELDVDMRPEDALAHYVDEKMEFSRQYPEASRVFANEILAGAPNLKPVIETRLKDQVKKKARVIRQWIKQGKIDSRVDPYHLIMMIWAVTQHYADFSVQIRSILGKGLDDPGFYNQTRKTIKHILISGIAP